MRIIDLTRPINNEMAGVNISQAKTIEREGWNATTLQLYSHCGTHMDAPCHFVSGAATIDQQDLNVIVGDAIVVNLAPATAKQLFRVEDFASVADQVTPGCRLLLRTDWHKVYGTAEYRNELPRVSIELARWFVDQRVGLIGVEPPSVADVNNIEEVTTVHQTLFHGNVVIVEGLVNLDQLTQPVVKFAALPLKLVGGDGSPVRAIAMEEIESQGRQPERGDL